MEGSFTTTVQFPSRRDYKKLKMLAVLDNRTVGEKVKGLVDDQMLTYTKAEIRKTLNGAPELIQIALSQ